jgi:hypothetical protein
MPVLMSLKLGDIEAMTALRRIPANQPPVIDRVLSYLIDRYGKAAVEGEPL